MTQTWSGRHAEQAAVTLIAVAAALLFLDAAATMHVVYTIRISYLCAAAAIAVGAPFVVRGARRLPPTIAWAGLALLAVYVLAAVLGHQLVLPGDSRTGRVRSVVYVLDLTLGVASFALIPGLFRSRARLRLLAFAFVTGGAVAAGYAIYQWFAQRYGLPLTDVNNTLDSNGITSGANQGAGVFGWTRARGTFLEPHFLGDYIASILPLAAGVALVTRGRLRALFAAITVALVLALVITSSAPDFVVLLVGVLVAGTAFTIGRGWVAAAAALGLVTATVAVLTPLTLLSPAPIAAATGRPEADIGNTIQFRTDTWSRAVEIWRQRPALGFGPGQSSVQLAAATDVPRALRPATPTSLQSAQGIWAAALVDAGVAGLACWVVLLSSAGLLTVRVVARSPSVATWAVAATAVAAIAGEQITGDRLDLRVWLLLGFGVAVASTEREERAEVASGSDEQAAQRADLEPDRT